MTRRIDSDILQDLSAHTRRLGLKRLFQSMGYERAGELPLVVSHLKASFHSPLRHLDVGSGDSILPSYLLKHSLWDITCIDKFASVEIQKSHCDRVMNEKDDATRLHVVHEDFLRASMSEASFDVVTCISVIEHFEGATDSLAVAKMARLLKPGGKLLLTTTMNDRYFKEFFIRQPVYGESSREALVFFQRHYDVESFQKRIVDSSELRETDRVYFGDYDFQFAEKCLVMPWPWKPLKLLYQWATPFFALRYLTYRDYPVSREDMHMYTASGVFVVLKKGL